MRVNPTNVINHVALLANKLLIAKAALLGFSTLHLQFAYGSPAADYDIITNCRP